MRNIKNLINISGMPKEYEDACQDMLQAGYEWLVNNNQIKNPKKFYKKDQEELELVIVKAVDDCSGAMHSAVMGHLIYIRNNDVDLWEAVVTEHRKKNKLS